MTLKCHILLVATLALPKCTTAFFPSVVHPQNPFGELRTSSSHDAFPSLTSTRMPAHRVIRSETELLAKKGSSKRRRRKDGGSTKKKTTRDLTGEKSVNRGTPIGEDDGIELPDFDLVEDIDLLAASSGLENIPSVDMNDPEAIMEAMKPKGGIMPSSSTKDLLRSRNLELEKKFVVDDVTMEVPNLADYTRKSATGGAGGEGKVGKKAARAAARRDAAIEAEDAENSGVVALLSKLPKLPQLPFTGSVRDDKGDLNPIKVIEYAAWAGIYTLVIWEIYINSPLFTRAAPMAPVVFSDPATMT